MIRLFTVTIWLAIVAYFYFPTGAEVQGASVPEQPKDIFKLAQEQEDKYFKDLTPFIPNIEKSIECLAVNIYHESRNESVLGQAAVAWVVLNRVESSLFPESVCGVVYQARYSRWWKQEHDKNVPLRNQCQFSWYCDGKSDNINEWDKFEQARSIAYSVLMNKTPADPTKGALWYHADYVNPNWSTEYRRTVKIDTHIFYRK
jgi:spore germination cell wall hydrolase CwlJ-like protein